EILTNSPYADLMSEDRPWTDDERKIMLRQLNNYYTGFVHYVGEERHLSPGAAESAAKGRVWLGEEARRHKLTDQSGGLMDAIHYAAETAGIADWKYDIRVIEEPGGLFAFLGGGSLMTEGKSEAADLALGLFSKRAVRELLWMASLQQNP